MLKEIAHFLLTLHMCSSFNLTLSPFQVFFLFFLRFETSYFVRGKWYIYVPFIYLSGMKDIQHLHQNPPTRRWVWVGRIKYFYSDTCRSTRLNPHFKCRTNHRAQEGDVCCKGWCVALWGWAMCTKRVTPNVTHSAFTWNSCHEWENDASK